MNIAFNIVIVSAIIRVLVKYTVFYKSPVFYEITVYYIILFLRLTTTLVYKYDTPAEIPSWIILAFTLGIYMLVLVTISSVEILLRQDFEMLQNAKITIESSFRKVKELSETDQLTQLYNRHKMTELIHSCIELKKGLNVDFSVILIDIDHFKDINDNYGHNIGDKILKYFSDFLIDTLRTEDYIGRWGGDEFLIILTGVKPGNTEAVCSKIKTKLQSKKQDIINEPLEISVGYCEYEVHMSDDGVVHEADVMMYQDKNNKY